MTANTPSARRPYRTAGRRDADVAFSLDEAEQAVIHAGRGLVVALAAIRSAKALVEDVRAVVQDLGGHDPLGLLPATPARQQGARPSPGAVSDAVLAALPGTVAEIRERTGLVGTSVSSCLGHLRKAGLVLATGPHRRQVYSRSDKTAGGATTAGDPSPGDLGAGG